jgi:cytochrome d ubiquinol oxidase subunit II
VDLNSFWFILVTVLFTGFFFLEGFDYGVGMLLPFIGKTEDERATVAASIGPFWDGNEVWLLTAGGAIFAAFPQWYATLFSGFYPALLLVVVGLIVRAVAFEFRNQDERHFWHNIWDWAIFGGSFIPALIWGVAVANFLEGVPIDSKMNYVGGFWNLLNPYALLGGVSFVALFALHGAIFLNLKTEGVILARVQQVAKRLWIPTVVVVAAFVVLAYFASDIFTRSDGFNPYLPAAGAAVALVAAGLLVQTNRYGWAFVATALTIALATLTVFSGMFPRVMISNLGAANDLTIHNASSSDYTLTVMSWVAITFVPFVLGYQAWNYWVFRKRVSLHSGSHY